MDSLQGKRVLVLGYGRQGRALARWLPTRGASGTVRDRQAGEPGLDELPPGARVEFVSGEHSRELLDETDLICLSGGVPLDAPLVREAQARGIPLANDAQLFLERCPAPVIGITGSAGKTTTTSLVAAMLQAAGRQVWTGGNIGHVLLDDLDSMQAGDVVAMELSSCQLELMTRSPQLALVLNVTPNHLDRHGSMAAYAAAKARILEFQGEGDCAILGHDDAGSRALEAQVRGGLAWFGRDKPPGGGAWDQENDLWVCGGCTVTGRARR
ncbi:MAG: Mur ligase family protein, partial [Anaerolineaceae bacterium]|nr:Mur ligase family protein [Anaerolineaceae bacterium]